MVNLVGFKLDCFVCPLTLVLDCDCFLDLHPLMKTNTIKNKYVTINFIA